jgi:hypothetical protein
MERTIKAVVDGVYVRSIPSQRGQIAMCYVLRFGDEECRSRLLAGGKEATLAELTQAGFPVPAGFCVTALPFLPPYLLDLIPPAWRSDVDEGNRSTGTPIC